MRRDFIWLCLLLAVAALAGRRYEADPLVLRWTVAPSADFREFAELTITRSRAVLRVQVPHHTGRRERSFDAEPFAAELKGLPIRDSSDTLQSSSPPTPR